MKIKKVVALGAAVGVALTGLSLVGAAQADPVSNSYVLVGSDTLQDVANALVNGTGVTNSNVQVKSNGASLGSFDAFGSATIQTKPGGPFFARPGGSGAGRDALIASITGASYQGKVITGQVDIARSSSDWGTNASAVGDLVYVPFGRDALGYAYKVDPNWPTAVKDAFGSLTQAELADIYSATLETPYVVATVSGVDYKAAPRLPQTASGTRQTFLGKLGFATTATPGSVPAGDNTASGPAENDATVLSVAGAIIPFSAASWIAQANGLTSANTTNAANVSFGHADGLNPFAGSAPNLAPNPGYFNTPSVWGRDTYLIVEYARTVQFLPGTATPNPRYDAGLAALVRVTGPGQTSLVSNGTSITSPGKVKSYYGFLPPSSTTPQRAYSGVYADTVWPGFSQVVAP